MVGFKPKVACYKIQPVSIHMTQLYNKRTLNIADPTLFAPLLLLDLFSNITVGMFFFFSYFMI